MKSRILLALVSAMMGIASPAIAQMGGSQWVNAKPGKAVDYTASAPLPEGLLKRIGKDDGPSVIGGSLRARLDRLEPNVSG